MFRNMKHQQIGADYEQHTHWEEASRRPSCEKSRSMVERGEGVSGQ